jgi:hypothetical protein
VGLIKKKAKLEDLLLQSLSDTFYKSNEEKYSAVLSQAILPRPFNPNVFLSTDLIFPRKSISKLPRRKTANSMGVFNITSKNIL